MECDVAVLGGNRAGDRGEATSLSLALDRGQQAGLANPRLAGEQKELTPAGGGLLEAPICELEQVVAPDQERATNVSWRDMHEAESRPRA